MAANVEPGLAQIFPDGKALILAIDHDFNIATGRSGVPDIQSHLSVAAECGVDAVLAHRDVLGDLANASQLSRLGKILQVNAAGRETDARVMIYSDLGQMAQEAASFNAQVLGFQVNFGSNHEVSALQDLEKVGKAASAADLSLFIHLYLRREGRTFNDLPAEEYGDRVDTALKTVAGLGAQVVKLAVRDGQTFERSVDTAHRLGLHIVAAGGAKTAMAGLLSNAATVMDLGADGLTVGRNAFERPVGDSSPLLDVAPSTESADVSGPAERPGRIKIRDDEITALGALRAVVHFGARDMGRALVEAQALRSAR